MSISATLTAPEPNPLYHNCASVLNGSHQLPGSDESVDYGTVSFR